MTESETALITGGTGFIGAHLAEALLEDGHDVIVFDTAMDPSLLDRLNIADAVRIVQGDVTDLATLARTIRETETTRLIHLAALLSDDIAIDELAATRSNTVGPNNVLEAARLFPDQINRVVMTSSETVYAPESAYDSPVTEDAMLLPDPTYSAAKRHAECLAQSYRQQHDVPVVNLRMTGVFCPFRRSFTEFSNLFEKPAIGEPVRVSGGSTTVSWLYVKDAADAFRRAPLAPSSTLTHSVYNIRGEVATVGAAGNIVQGVARRCNHRSCR